MRCLVLVRVLCQAGHGDGFNSVAGRLLVEQGLASCVRLCMGVAAALVLTGCGGKHLVLVAALTSWQMRPFCGAWLLGGCCLPLQHAL